MGERKGFRIGNLGVSIFCWNKNNIEDGKRKE